jgi:TPR repeat protein
MRRPRRSFRIALLAALVATHAVAAPADEHQRARVAYSRGDVTSAMRLLRAPADAGYAPSQTMLAFILDRADVADEAARLYQAAAVQGDAEAHAALGSFYASGRGVAKDENQALAHFSKAADLGHAHAIGVVADAHLQGRLGSAPVDASRSAAALRRAAEQGHLASAQALAEAYSVGRYGLTPDAAEAAAWQARVKALREQQRIPPAKRSR